MNLTAEDLASGALRDRVKVGASLADVDPMSLDSSVRQSSKNVKQQNIHSDYGMTRFYEQLVKMNSLKETLYSDLPVNFVVTQRSFKYLKLK